MGMRKIATGKMIMIYLALSLKPSFMAFSLLVIKMKKWKDDERQTKSGCS